MTSAAERLDRVASMGIADNAVHFRSTEMLPVVRARRKRNVEQFILQLLDVLGLATDYDFVRALPFCAGSAQ